MEIGAKIKEARTRTGLTQEQAAEALGVSRKTISNWENEKTYPDIVSVVKMSDLYAVSLDRLLKDGEGGSEYLDYLGDSTDTVRSRRRLSILVLLTAYLCVWGLAVIVFWFFTTGSDAMGSVSSISGCCCPPSPCWYRFSWDGRGLTASRRCRLCSAAA